MVLNIQIQTKRLGCFALRGVSVYDVARRFDDYRASRLECAGHATYRPGVARGGRPARLVAHAARRHSRCRKADTLAPVRDLPNRPGGRFACLPSVCRPTAALRRRLPTCLLVHGARRCGTECCGMIRRVSNAFRLKAVGARRAISPRRQSA